MHHGDIKVGDLVVVIGGKPGAVRYLCPNGDFGVALVNERGRVDEWMPSQVVKVSAKTAVAMSKRFLPARLGGTA